MPSRLEDVFFFTFWIKLSCNTGPSKGFRFLLWRDRIEEITNSLDTHKKLGWAHCSNRPWSAPGFTPQRFPCRWCQSLMLSTGKWGVWDSAPHIDWATQAPPSSIPGAPWGSSLGLSLWFFHKRIPEPRCISGLVSYMFLHFVFLLISIMFLGFTYLWRCMSLRSIWFGFVTAVEYSSAWMEHGLSSPLWLDIWDVLAFCSHLLCCFTCSCPLLAITDAKLWGTGFANWRSQPSWGHEMASAVFFFNQ